MGGSRRTAIALLVAVLCIVASCASAQDGDGQASADGTEITVAAASDLRPAFEELAEVFTADTGIDVTFSFGSSGLLREQVINGAPFDLYASANSEYVDAVIEAGAADPATRMHYATGRVALWSSEGIEPPTQIEDLVDPRFEHIAIANPTHAPYGVAAEQALRSAGIYDQIEDRLILGENIADTHRIAESGNAQVGIIALSLVIDDDDGEHVLIPAELHEPITQTMVVTGSGTGAEPAAEFIAIARSAEGRAIFERYGFEVPDE